MKRDALYALLATVALTGAFLAGRQSVPTKVVTTERATALDLNRSQTVTVERKAEEKHERKQVRRTRITRPDGTREEILTVDRGTDTARTETVAKTEVKEVIVYRDHEATKSVTPSPRPWFVGPMLLAAPGAFKIDRPADMFSVGIVAGRHLVGPLSVSASATVPVTHPVSWPVLTVALTASF